LTYKTPTKFLPRRLLALARRVLQSAGYKVLMAASGDEALLVLAGQQEPVHLVLTDVVMPGMGGYELAKRCREVHPGVKVLYTSGYTDDALLRRNVLDEEVPFVGKPFTAAGLTENVRKALDFKVALPPLRVALEGGDAGQLNAARAAKLGTTNPVMRDGSIDAER